MRFSMDGRLRGGEASRRVYLSWEDGHMFGDPEVLKRVRRFAKVFADSTWSASQDLATKGHPLDDPYAAAAIFRQMFELRSVELKGNWPPPIELPPGAVP